MGSKDRTPMYTPTLPQATKESFEDLKSRLSAMTLSQNNVDVIRECLELLRAIESIEYHNKNWLPQWAIENPKDLSREKLALIERMLSIMGTAAGTRYT